MNLESISIDTVITIISILIALVSIIISIYYSRKSIKIQNEIALLQGVYKNENIDINVFHNENTQRIIIGFKKDKINGSAIINIPLTIVNTGNKPIEDIDIYVWIPKFLIPMDINKTKAKLSELVEGKLKIINVFDKGEIKLICIKLSKLKVSEALDIYFPFFLKKDTSINFATNLKTKDDYQIPLKVDLEYQIMIDFLIKTDNNSYVKKIGVSLFDYSNFETFTDLLRNKNNSRKIDKLTFKQAIKNVINSYKNKDFNKWQKVENCLFIYFDEKIDEESKKITEYKYFNGKYWQLSDYYAFNVK